MSKESRKDYLDEIELPKSIQKEIEKIAKEKRLRKDQIKVLEREVKKEYLHSRFEPGEAVGIVAAQSISEPATQMSLDANEKILIKKDGYLQPIRIGDFVDKLIERFGCIKEGGSEILDLPNEIDIFVYSLDQDEKLKLKRIKSVIRHKSPKKLLEIKTASGRRIIATDHHSFVIRKDNQIIPVSGKDLKIGDRIPAIKFLPEHCISEIKMTSILPDRIVKIGNNVYPYIAHSKGLPNTLVLNSSLGWFIGAYLAEGNYTKNFVNISNTNEEFNQKVRNFANRFQFTVNEYDNFRGFSKGHDIHINSSLLSRFLKETCGDKSRNKKVPFFAFSADEEFVSSLLQAYFDGDGSITLEKKGIRVFSKSKELLDGIAILLTRFGIFCSKSDDGHWLWIPYKYSKAFLQKIGTSLPERRKILEKLSKEFENKRVFTERTDMIPGIDNLLLTISKKLKLPTRYVNNFTKRQRIGRETLRKYIKKFERLAEENKIDISKELEILKRALNSDVVWDRIEEISYIDSKSKYVYDISVEGLETFATFSGLITHNTMRTYHFAGTAGVKVTYGLPRLIEIFDAKRVPETPMMTIFLKREYNNEKYVKKVAENIIEKKIEDLMKRISINLNENLIELELLDRKRINTVINILKESFKGVKVRKRGDKIVIVPLDETDIRQLQKLKEKITQTTISGIKGVANAVVRREGDEWIINTIGSNLLDVLKMKEVNHRKTITNDVHEVARTLGIEAARNVIVEEAMKTLQEQGLDVDIRHVLLVADIMCFTGNVSPIGRYGVAGSKASVLARAAFEETIKHLVRASIRNEADNFNGIFENVMIGQVIPSGTGMFDLIAKLEE
jgi:DNA-directed RNA polymerase subunit A"